MVLDQQAFERWTEKFVCTLVTVFSMFVFYRILKRRILNNCVIESELFAIRNLQIYKKNHARVLIAVVVSITKYKVFGCYEN